MLTSKQIEDCLPIRCWEQGCLVSQTGDISVPFELYLPEVYSQGRENFDAMHQAWVRAMRCLPDDCIVHKQDCFVERNFIPQKSDNGFLSEASDRHFTGRKYLQHRCFLYISLSSAKNMTTSSLFSILCRARLIPEDMLDEHRLRTFMDVIPQFCQLLQENGISVRRMSADELIGSPHHAGLMEQYIALDFSDELVLPDLLLNGKDLTVGDKYVSCFALSDLEQLPSEVHTCVRHDKFSVDSTYFAIAYTHGLGLELPFNHIYNQYFFFDSHLRTMKAVEQRGREQQSLSKISRQNAINKEFNDQYLNEAVKFGRRSVRCAANLLLWDENFLRLQKKNAQAGARLVHIDCTANKVEGIVPQVFWAGIPGAASQYPAEMTFLTFLEQAACFIYPESHGKGSHTGIGLRLCDRLFGVPLQVDISDEPRKKGWIDNRNKFILGPSGSGKSFFTNHLVRQYYEQGCHVVIVDVGDSYKGLCQLIREESAGNDGVYYTYTEEHPISFNPFYAPDGMYSIEKREQLAALVFCLWKNETEQITKAEETQVSAAINGYLTQLTETHEFPCFTGFYDFLSGPFKEHITQQQVERDNFDLNNLLQVLKPYASGGMYDYLLNAREHLNLLEKRFIVFEIDNIKDHKTLFPVVTLVLMDTFISKMRHPSLANQRKMILMEEAWKAISKQGTAEFIKYLYKTVRKHFGEAVVVTQEVEDIIGNPIIKNAIISNADCKILLDQRKYANRFDEIRQILALTDKETAMALSVNRDLHSEGRSTYKEVFITLNGNHTAVYAVEVSREEYLCYTTEKKEKEQLLRYERQTGDIRQAICQYIQSTLNPTA